MKLVLIGVLTAAALIIVFDQVRANRDSVARCLPGA